MQTLVFGLGLTDSTLNWTHDFPRDVSQDLQYHSSSVTKSLSNHCKFVKMFPTRLYTTIQHLFKNKAFLALVSLKPMSVSCLRMVWNKKMHILQLTRVYILIMPLCCGLKNPWITFYFFHLNIHYCT